MYKYYALLQHKITPFRLSCHTQWPTRLSMLMSSKTAIWNTRQIAFPKQSLLVEDFKLLQMMCNNICTHFAKPRGLICTQMHCEKAGGVSCFVQQTHTNIV